MNKVILMGRLTKDPEVRYTQGEVPAAIARYTLAVGRPKKTGEVQSDFVSCTAFSRSAEFAEKYLRKGMKIVLIGHLQTGSYTNREGQKIYTTSVVAENQEFAESKRGGTQDAGGVSLEESPAVSEEASGYVPDGMEDIPFD